MDIITKPRVLVMDTPEQIWFNNIKIFLGYKQCYQKDSIIDLHDKYSIKNVMESEELQDEIVEYLSRMVLSSHMSPLEHATITFFIEGVSLNVTHQFVRHRISSYSQKSHRYKEALRQMVLPSSVLAYNEKNYGNVISVMESVYDLYEDMVAHKVPKEDARYVLPTGLTTSITTTKNLRNTIDYLHERCCTKSQYEHRQVADMLKTDLLSKYRYLAPILGAKCLALDFCPEKKSCGYINMVKKDE